MYAYISPPAMVHLSKPDKSRERSFVDKTGGGNDNVNDVERTFTYKPVRGT